MASVSFDWIGASQYDKAVSDIQSETNFIRPVADLCIAYVYTNKFLRFTAENLTTLCRGTYGLRCVVGQELFKQECEKGVKQGCSVNFSPLTLCEEFEIQPEATLIKFAKGVDHFIGRCLVGASTGRVKPDQSKVSDYLDMVKACRFMFLRYDEGVSPSDFHLMEWGRGLGRFPKMDLSAERIKPIPALTVDQCATEKEQQELITMNSFSSLEKRVVAAFRSVIIMKLRSDASPFFGNDWIQTSLGKNKRTSLLNKLSKINQQKFSKEMDAALQQA